MLWLSRNTTKCKINSPRPVQYPNGFEDSQFWPPLAQMFLIPTMTAWWDHDSSLFHDLHYQALYVDCRLQFAIIAIFSQPLESSMIFWWTSKTLKWSFLSHWATEDEAVMISEKNLTCTVTASFNSLCSRFSFFHIPPHILLAMNSHFWTRCNDIFP